MAILGVDDFKSKLTGGGARPNLFKVTCNFPTYVGADVELASFMVKAAQLPASVLGLVEVPFRGRKLMMAGDRTFEPWTISVLNNGINAHSANTGLANPTDYFADMIVEQLDNSGSVVKKYDFRGTWPSNVGAIELNYDEATAIEEFEVELQIQYWESNTTS